MKTELLKIKGDWEEVVNDCRSTVGKDELGHEPSMKFKLGILIAEHTPIRDISIKWRWRNMKHWVTVHWVRHKFEKFVRTQRSDRTGVPRDKLPQDEPQTFTGDANCQHLIDAQRKRLCRKASSETREYAEDLKATLMRHPVVGPVGAVLVPNCVYRCGCPEMSGCGWFQAVIKREPNLLSVNILTRYKAYNRIFSEDFHE